MKGEINPQWDSTHWIANGPPTKLEVTSIDNEELNYFNFSAYDMNQDSMSHENCFATEFSAHPSSPLGIFWSSGSAAVSDHSWPSIFSSSLSREQTTGFEHHSRLIQQLIPLHILIRMLVIYQYILSTIAILFHTAVASAFEEMHTLYSSGWEIVCTKIWEWVPMK